MEAPLHGSGDVAALLAALHGRDAPLGGSDAALLAVSPLGDDFLVFL
jgi:hypothetical protein